MSSSIVSVGGVLAGSEPPFYLRPMFDELAAELGVPLVGFPKECEFVWPVDAPARPKPTVKAVPRRRRQAGK